MADIWSIESDENLDKLIQNYRDSQTKEHYLEVIQGAKRAAKEKAIHGKFALTEQVLRKVWSLPQVDASSNYLQEILDSLDVDFFWEAVENGINQSSPEDKEGLSQILSRMSGRIIPKLLILLKKVREPEFFYKIALLVGNKDVGALIKGLESPDEAISYQAHIILKRLKSPKFLEKLSEFKKHPSALVRNLIVGVLRGYNTPSVKVEMMAFLKDEDPKIRKAVLSSPQNLAEKVNFDELLELVQQKQGAWEDQEIRAIFQALILADEEKIQKWLDETFRKKAGLFGGKAQEKMKDLFIDGLTGLDEKSSYQLAGELLGETEYHISAEGRKKLLGLREKAKLDKAKKTGQYSRGEIKELMRVHQEGGLPDQTPASQIIKTESLEGSQETLSSSPEGQSEGDKAESPKTEVSTPEVPSPSSKDQLEGVEIDGREELSALVIEFPLFSDTDTDTEKIGPSRSGGARGAFQGVGHEIAQLPTQDLTDDLKEARKIIDENRRNRTEEDSQDQGGTEENLVEDEALSESLSKAASEIEGEVKARERRDIAEEDTDVIEVKELRAIPSLPPMEKKISQIQTKGPDLLLRLVKELYNLDPGKFLNILQNFFGCPFEENSEIEEQRTKLILFLCSNTEKSTLMFLDYLRSEERFGLSEKLKKMIEITLKREGLLF